ncbi:MAG: hypothetical protein M1837_000389 [Sclerophora amabilis]|nr:MAG: hypothetical protein M1837_000389 [Sclerophora amabilis]
MYFTTNNTTTSSSPTSSPIIIPNKSSPSGSPFSSSSASPTSSTSSGSPLSPADSVRSRSASRATSLHVGKSCAYPSWPNRASLSCAPNHTASAHISDADLFPEVFEEIDEPQVYQAPRVRLQRPAPPDYAHAITPSSAKQKKGKKSTKKKQRKLSVPMTPIPESPE